MSVLILGGTTEARELATALARTSLTVTTALAGRVADPRRPPGYVRIGGFGGPEGLARWVAAHRVRALVDATHPFATRISAAAARAGIPALRLERPGWREQPGDRWRWVDDLHAAAALTHGRRVFLTSGQRDLHAFADVDDAFFLVRTISPPAPPLPRDHELLLARGPHSLADELALIDRHRLDTLVTKDSGGDAAKLAAARARGLEVVIVRRPPAPPTPTVQTVAEALAWLAYQLRPHWHGD